MLLVKLILGILCALVIVFTLLIIGVIFRMKQKSHLQAPLPPLQQLPDGVESTITLRDGTQLRAWHKGSGPAVLLLHNLGVSAITMNRIWHLLAGYGFKVITFDWRGHGLSQEGEHLGMETMAADLREVIAHFQLKEFTLAGHAWGTLVALDYMLTWEQEAQEKVRGIVSIAGFAGTLHEEANLHKRLLSTPWIQALILKSPLKWLLASAYFGANWDSNQLKAFWSIYTARPLKRLIPLWKEQESMNLYDRLREIDTPVAILWGKHDQITSRRHTQRMVKGFSNLKAKLFDEQGGHMLVWESPGKIAEAIRTLVPHAEWAA